MTLAKPVRISLRARGSKLARLKIDATGDHSAAQICRGPGTEIKFGQDEIWIIASKKPVDRCRATKPGDPRQVDRK